MKMASRKEEFVFDNPYTGKCLIYILEKEKIMKSELLQFANNHAIDKALDLLQRLELINIREERTKYLTYWITLTDEGIKTAKLYKQLRNINNIDETEEENYRTPSTSVQDSIKN